MKSSLRLTASALFGLGLYLCGFVVCAYGITVYIPHITGNDSAWTDTLIADNTGESTAEYTLTLYSDGSQAYAVTRTVPPRGTDTVDVKSNAPSAEFGIVDYTEEDLIFRVGYEHTSGGVAELALNDETYAKAAFLFSPYASLVDWSGPAAANPGTADLQAVLYAVGGGNILDSAQVTIPAKDRIVGTSPFWFPGPYAAPIDRLILEAASGAITGISVSGNSAFTNLLFTPAQAATFTTTSAPSLKDVKYWAYQIQGLSEDGAVDVLAATHYDLLVLEPTRTDWSDDSPDAERYFNTKAAVTKLKATKASDGSTRKLVLAYIDIGQAEDWRWYWTWSTEEPQGSEMPADWPEWIAALDPDGWTGNYVVHYWHPAWKDIVIYGQNTGTHPDRDYTSIIDEVLKDGFDGIYLDWVEAFENPAVIAQAQLEGKNPVNEMISFIKEMRTYSRARNPNFLIIQQNASALVLENTEILSVVDGIAQEGIWYEGIATDEWNDPQGCDDPVDSTLTGEYHFNLGKYRAAGLPVLDCEYACSKAADAYSKAAAKGYIPYATRRSLSKLTETPPPGY